MSNIDDKPSDNHADVSEDSRAVTKDGIPVAPPIESPLIKLINAITGGKKKGGSPASKAAVPRPDPAIAAAATATAVAPAPSKEPSVRKTAADKNAPPPSGAPGGPLMTVVVRNEFYRDGFRNMMRIAILESIIIVGLILTFIAHINSSQPQDHYFATTADGRIIQLVPLNLPNMGTAALMSWVAQSATEVMTFGYHDYQRRMQQSSRHFTRRGWETFTIALQKSRIIESVESLQQVVTAQPRSAPILIQEGVFNGKYRWVIDLPLSVMSKGATNNRTDTLNIRLTVDRVPSLENPNGVGIESWVARQS